MQRSYENYLRWNFGRCIDNGWAPNVRPIAPNETSGPPLEPGESAIAFIELSQKSQSLLMTDRRLVRDATTLVRWDDVTACFWIDRNKPIGNELKQEKYHRIILDLGDNREITLEGLGPAVFPLLNFFQFHLRRKAAPL